MARSAKGPRLDGVSIRSPHRSKGRSTPRPRDESNPGFQSAPLTEARGDRLLGYYHQGLRVFQSAPLTEARGDWFSNAPTPRLIVFQSAPLTEARGDLSNPIDCGAYIRGFNPLPSPKQGEIGRRPGDYLYRHVSIRSPHRSKGRYLPPGRYGLHLVRFQSAPLTEARGDSRLGHDSIGARIVSIRSPHRSKGRSGRTVATPAPAWFQSAPLTEARGDPPLAFWWPANSSFNPLPSPKQGEISRGWPIPIICTCFNPLPSPKQGEMLLVAA